jgi:hypothetical protein
MTFVVQLKVDSRSKEFSQCKDCGVSELVESCCQLGNPGDGEHPSLEAEAGTEQRQCMCVTGNCEILKINKTSTSFVTMITKLPLISLMDA